MSHTTMEYQFYEIKAIVDLRKTVLKELFAKGELIAEVAKAILPSVLEFLKDCQVQSRHVEAKLAEREFERSDEAKQLVFNIQKGENCSYDEERMIVTEIGKKGVVFEVNTADLELIGKIREQGETWQAADAEWGKISSIRIERNSVWMEQCSVPAELRGVEAELE